MATRTCSRRLVVPILVFAALLRMTPAAAPVPEIAVVSKPFTNLAHVFGDSAAIDLSADGRWAVFNSSGNGLATNDNNGLKVDLFLKDLNSSATTLVSRNLSGASADGDSLLAGISGDGRFVLFESDADDLIEGDDNESTDVFLYDRDTATITLVSRTSEALAD